MRRRSIGLAAALGVAAALVTLPAAGGGAATVRLMATEDDPPPQLVLPGERVRVAFQTQLGERWTDLYNSIDEPTGTLHVRNDLDPVWRSVPLRPGDYELNLHEQLVGAFPRDVVAGSRVEFWADFRVGRRRTVYPPGGAVTRTISS